MQAKIVDTLTQEPEEVLQSAVQSAWLIKSRIEELTEEYNKLKDLIVEQMQSKSVTVVDFRNIGVQARVMDRKTSIGWDIEKLKKTVTPAIFGAVTELVPNPKLMSQHGVLDAEFRIYKTSEPYLKLAPLKEHKPVGLTQE
ncbi:MAG: hypothetical protein HY376_01940 [Candidatus Blackburnbacteria bacterium]|nr:hypothetical protein [Candidatus Blackburnbacteria bacterium]